MNQVEIARAKLLIALFVDSHRPDKRSLSREQIESEYFTRLDTPLFNSLVTEFRRSGLVKAYPDRATYFVRLRTDAHATALNHILNSLDAKTFDVNWQGQRIGTDADAELANELLAAIPDGWLLMTYEKNDPIAPKTPSAPSQVTAGGDFIWVGGDVHQSSIAGRPHDSDG